MFALLSQSCLADLDWKEIPGASGEGGSAAVVVPDPDGGLDSGLTGAASAAGGEAANAGGVGGGARGDSVRDDGGTAGNGTGGGAGGGAVSCAQPLADCPVITSTRLPAPCAGIAYAELLAATGGAGSPYTWSTLSAPLPDFELDTASGRISGANPTSGGLLTVQVEDAAGNTARHELDLRVRASCWLAYLSEESQPARLHLRDVFLTQDIVLPGAAEPDPVIDFKFSPNGRWLALRAGTAERYRLFLYATRPPRQADATPIVFECPDDPSPLGCGVLDYAWSESSNHLAVVLRGASPEQDYLSGLSELNGEASIAGVPWQAMGTARWVGTDIPLDYHEQLRWAGSSALGFLGQNSGTTNPDLPHALYSALLSVSGAGVEGLTGKTELLPPVGSTLLPAASGLAVVFPLDAYKTVGFYRRTRPALGQEAEELTIQSGLLSPSGLWIGVASGEAGLELYDVADDTLPVAASDAAGCDAIAAWSPRVEGTGLERIACVVESGLQLFDYLESPSRLVPAGSIALDHDLVGARRAFSPSGQSLAFGGAEGRFAVFDLSQFAPTPDPEVVPPVFPDPPVELEFPAGREVVAISDTGFFLESALRGSTAAARSFIFSDLATRSPCQESFWEKPLQWCGAPHIVNHFTYSNDAKSLMLEDSVTGLKLAQPGEANNLRLLTDALSPCGAGCTAKPYSFQP